VHQNPLRLAVPPGPPITAELRIAFEESLQPLLEQLELIRGMNLAGIN
jgi:hypothetical protein